MPSLLSVVLCYIAVSSANTAFHQRSSAHLFSQIDSSSDFQNSSFSALLDFSNPARSSDLVTKRHHRKLQYQNDWLGPWKEGLTFRGPLRGAEILCSIPAKKSNMTILVLQGRRGDPDMRTLAFMSEALSRGRSYNREGENQILGHDTGLWIQSEARCLGSRENLDMRRGAVGYTAKLPLEAKLRQCCTPCRKRDSKTLHNFQYLREMLLSISLRAQIMRGTNDFSQHAQTHMHPFRVR